MPLVASVQFIISRNTRSPREDWKCVNDHQKSWMEGCNNKGTIFLYGLRLNFCMVPYACLSASSRDSSEFRRQKETISGRIWHYWNQFLFRFRHTSFILRLLVLPKYFLIQCLSFRVSSYLFVFLHYLTLFISYLLDTILKPIKFTNTRNLHPKVRGKPLLNA